MDGWIFFNYISLEVDIATFFKKSYKKHKAYPQAKKKKLQAQTGCPSSISHCDFYKNHTVLLLLLLTHTALLSSVLIWLLCYIT